MEHLTQTFAQCKQEGRPALVTYVTAGFPTAEETPEIMLGMQAGGVGQSSLNPFAKQYPARISKRDNADVF
jgi:hypothetical protein